MRKKIVLSICATLLIMGMISYGGNMEVQASGLSDSANLTVAGVDIVSGGEVTGDLPEGAEYDLENNVLTLSDFSYEEDSDASDVDSAVYARGMGADFVVHLEGENTISVASEDVDIDYLVYIDEGTVEGPGTLNVLDTIRCGIGYNDLHIDGCTINITNNSESTWSAGIVGGDGELVISNSTININNNVSRSSTHNTGIDAAWGDITVEGSEINIELINGNVHGLTAGYEFDFDGDDVFGGSLTVNDSVIKCIVDTDGNNIESMSFYEINSTGELYYYISDGDTFVEKEFDEIFKPDSIYTKRYQTGESVIISSTPLSESCDHQWEEGEVITEATCEEKGETVYTCTLCGETKTEETDPLGHQWGDWEIFKEATCIEEGVQTRICGRCNEVENLDIEALGHDYVTYIITDATCTEDGAREDICSRCQATEDTVIPATGHSYGEWEIVKEATFNEDGEEVRICSVCGTEDTRRIPKLSESHTHDFSGEEEIITEATCTEEGWKKVYCTESECGEFQKEVIPAKGHTVGEWETVKEATCSETGREQQVCTVCGTVLETREIEKLEHTYGEWELMTEPTCTEAGVQKAVCEICGEETFRAIEALGHSYDEWEVVTSATCTETGEEMSICSRCGEEGSRVLEATGHTYGEWTITKEPTTAEEGQKEAVCEICGDVKTETISKLSAEQTGQTEQTSNETVNASGDEAESSLAPQTGDQTSAVLWLIVMVSALGMITFIMRKGYFR